MVTPTRYSLPPGRQPYDPVNGFRVGAVVGGLVAVLITVGLGFPSIWLALAGAVVGGAIGYRSEKRWRQPDRTDPAGGLEGDLPEVDRSEAEPR